MSSIVLMGLAATALAIAFMAFFSVTQAMERKQEEQQRLLKALGYRANSLTIMLAGFPQGFLPVEIRETVLRSVLEIYHQLKSADPKSVVFSEAFHDCEQQLAKCAQEPHQQQRRPQHLDNPAQLKEVRGNLKQLGHYLQQQVEQNRFSSVQAQQFEQMMHELQLQVTMDSYVMVLKQAQQAAKYPVAAHYCDLIVQLLQKDGSAHHQSQINHYLDMYRQFVALSEQQQHPDQHKHEPSAEEAALRTDLASGIKKHNYD